MDGPDHVAIILDGNGRWAKKRGLPRTLGHVQGAKEVEACCEYAWNMGVKYLTVYAFSTENWKRPPEEVKALMKLLSDYLKDSVERAMKNDMRVRVIGDKTALDQKIRDAIQNLEEKTRENTGLSFQIAINYGGRDELVRGMSGLLKKRMAEGNDAPITEEELSAYLDTAGLPDPDLLIRTCGEQRISNFLLWQLAYSELYFTEKPWPDFSKEELALAIEDYKKRVRKFGGIKA